VKFRKVVIKRLSNLDYAWIAALYSLQLFSLKIVLKNHDNAVILLGYWIALYVEVLAN